MGKQMDIGSLGALAFIIGLLLSVAATFFAGVIPAVPIILAMLGLIVGFLNITKKESLGFLISVIAIAMLSGTMAVLPKIGAIELGSILESMLGNIAIFAGSAGFVVALREMFQKAMKK